MLSMFSERKLEFGECYVYAAYCQAVQTYQFLTGMGHEITMHLTVCCNSVIDLYGIQYTIIQDFR